MGIKLKLTGQVFNRLTVIDEAFSKNRKLFWNCKCDCGNTIQVWGGSLVSGNTSSCGCYRKDLLTTHGDSKTRLNKIWRAMKTRCLNPKDKRYPYYGGRGLTVCEDWLASFSSFKKWAIANGYTDKLTIDRRNTNKGYSPENCRWATRAVQARNKNKSKNKSSKFMGVSWTKSNKKWKAYITINGNSINLGYFLDELDAAIARDTYVKSNKLFDYTINFK